MYQTPSCCAPLATDTSLVCNNKIMYSHNLFTVSNWGQTLYMCVKTPIFI